MMNKKIVFLLLVFSTGAIMMLADIIFLLSFHYPPSSLVSRFSIPAFIFMIIYCVLLGRNGKCFGAEYFKDLNNDTFTANIKKLGAIPIKLIAMNVALHVAFLSITFYAGDYLGVDPMNKTPLYMAALSFGMLIGTFVYVISDGMVSKSLLSHNFDTYPRDLRENRQSLKSMIIPLAAGIMSLIFGCSVAMLGIIQAGGHMEDMNSGAWMLIFVPIIVFAFCIILLTVSLKGNTKRIYASVVEQLENLSSDKKDLTRRITLCSIDEVGTITGMVNTLCEQLSRAIKDIKSGQKKLANAGTHLDEDSKNVAKAINEISDFSEIVVNKSHEQIESVKTSSKIVHEIGDLIEILEKSVAAQTNSMTQGSAAVEEMVGNISSIGTVTERMATQFKTVSEASENGIRIQTESRERIKKIVEQSQALQAANKMIATIASQTNLLAMNAAIEAAHAGEMGRGFSVVADEIRKLAENSSRESHKIGIELKEVVSTISEIVKDAESSGKAFTEVSRLINETDKLVIEVDHAIHEQKTGANQVLESLKAMNEINSHVADHSHKMSKDNEVMLREVKALHDSAEEVTSHMKDINKDIKKINEGAKDIAKQANVSKTSIEMISAIADGFEV
ncbi:MAG: methyl-accepting chemotaxis protein [Treponema sp.]|nr:methyl-accepting chemotaxis protein [Treponema sp.]